MNKRIVFALIAGLALSLPLVGQSLYGSGIPPESALIRVIFLDGNRGQDIEIGTATFSPSDFETSSRYHPVSPGMYYFQSGSDWVELIPRSGRYYTVIIEETSYELFEDEAHNQPARNQIYFYNLMDDETATLQTSSSGDVLFRDVKPGISVQTAVNPLDIEFAVVTSSEERLELGALPMSRGGSTSVLLHEDNGKLKAEVLKAEILGEQ